MSLTDSQIANLIDHIEAGKTLQELRALYPDTQEVAEIYEAIAFLKAQTCTESPDPSGLQSALNQAVVWDDDRENSGWGQFFKKWRWFMGGSLSFALLSIIFAPWETAPTETLVIQPEAVPVAEFAQMSQMRSAVPEMAMMAMDDAMADSEDPEMDALLQQLESDFESEFAQYKNLKESVMPFAAEEMFSAQMPLTIDAL